MCRAASSPSRRQVSFLGYSFRLTVFNSVAKIFSYISDRNINGRLTAAGGKMTSGFCCFNIVNNVHNVHKGMFKLFLGMPDVI